ncbi:MAG TPA: tetratricopeptide repeat protein [Acidobacteriota bacterium]|nr:tetratricopeptide repeat protein [Acidobacteriota bacterium]
MPNRKEAPKGAAREAGAPRLQLLFVSVPRPDANVLAIAAAFLAGLLYLPALQYGWVWDDAVLAAARGAGGAASSWPRPVLEWLQRGEWWLGAGNPALFHFTNLAFHAAGTWLFFLFATHVGLGPGIAFLFALLFGAHPVHVESVAYVSGRPAMVAAVFSLGALLAARTRTLCSPEGCRSKTIYAAYVLYALAAFTHEAALVTPFLLMGLDRWGPERVPATRRRVHYAGFLAIFFVAMLLRFAGPAGIAPSPAERGLPEAGRAGALLIAAATNLRLLAWPFPANAMRALGESEAADPSSLLLAAGALLAVAAIVWWRRRDAAVRAGALVLALGLVVSLPFSGFSAAFASDRDLYLASAGFGILVAGLAAAIAARGRFPASAVTLAGLAVAVGAGFAVQQRLPVWRDNIPLLEAATVADRSDPRPCLRLADHHAARGDARSALAALDQALVRDSTLAEARSRRALILGSLGRWPEAEEDARRAVAARPNDAGAWASLGDALAQQGKAAEAVEASRRAVAIDSTHAAVWYNYGVSLAGTQDAAGAEAAYRRALSIDSTLVEAWNNLGALYGGAGRIAEARDAYLKAVELAPSSIQARMNLALAYLRLGDKERAAQERLMLQRMDPAAARRLSEFFQELDAPAANAGGAPKR